MMQTTLPETMVDSEAVVKSPEFINALKTLASALKWGTVTTEVKDSKIVMTRIQKDIKIS